MINTDTGGKFDVVQASATVYRKLIASMARPGTVMNIGCVSRKLSELPEELHAGFMLAMTLLDSEVHFHVHMKEDGIFEESIRMRTLCKTADISQAEYIFIDGDLEDSDLLDTLARINRGTLHQPDLGATLFVRVDKLSETSQDTADMIFSGPGIKTESYCMVTGLSPLLLTEREKVNAEYPLGIDMILFDESSNILAIPRTTQIKAGGLA